MAPPKEIGKSKSIEDVNAFMDSPKKQKNQKRQRKESTDEEDDGMSKLISQYRANTKIMKGNADAEIADSRKKIMDMENQQRQARRHFNESIFKSIADITSQVQADYNTMKENEQKFEQMIAAFMKCIRQATAANKQKLKTLYEMMSLKKQFEQIEMEQKEETLKLMEKLEGDIKNLREKFDKESKRKSLDRMRQILHAMQNDE